MGDLMATSSSMIIDLPNHILIEILLRLPIKTLVASRCVCRSWLHLIADPHFAKLHMTRAPKEFFLRARTREDVSTALYMPDLQAENNGYLGKLNVVFDLPRFSVKADLSINFNATSSTLYMVNCCNGFICYSGPSHNKFVVIWNPMTGEFLVSPATRKDKDRKILVSHGFGFSPKTNRYKLLRMVHWYDLNQQLIADKAFVVTLYKEEFWKSVPNKPYRLLEPLCPTFLGNSLHWICNDATCPETIVSFNFDHDRFEAVPPPPHLVKKKLRTNWERSNTIYDLSLGILEDCLCINAETTNSATDIWVMKEFGVQDSWTIAFSIERYYPFSRRESYEVMQCFDSGEVVIALNSTHTFLYDRVKGTMILLGVGAAKLERILYRPSLCLLKDLMLIEEDATFVHNVKSRPSVFAVGRKLTGNPPWWRAWSGNTRAI